MLIAIPESVVSNQKTSKLIDDFGVKFVNPANIISIEYDGVETILKFDSGNKIVEFVYEGDCSMRLRTLIHRQERSAFQ